MKKIFLVFCLLTFSINYSYCQSIGIGGTPHASAILDLNSTNKGLLPPRMTFAERNLIVNPLAGLVVFCTDCGLRGELQIFDGTKWMNTTAKISNTNPLSVSANLVDIDGNQYPAVTICNQTWMAKNLNVTKYKNGEIIPQVQDPTQFANLTTGAWCYYENKASNGTIYGKLYNWYAVNDPRGLAPEGWHISTDEEWTVLTNCLGGEYFNAGKLKATGSIEQTNGYWNGPNKDATNSSGFNALPAGIYGVQSTLGVYANWWSATDLFQTGGSSLYRSIRANDKNIYRFLEKKSAGFSVRCVKDVEPPAAVIKFLNCGGATNNGSLISGTTVSANVTSIVPYEGGNGESYAAQAIASTGVAGLTATLAAGKIISGNGNLVFTISGTPIGSGTASFQLSIGGQKCTLNRTVNFGVTGISNHSCGSNNLHNASVPYGSLTDQDGNVYKTVQIGDQAWMAENLRTTKYRNGLAISNITDNTQWSNNTGGAYCSYNNSTSNDCPNGKLYNWYAVTNANQLCPSGWHVPSDGDWKILTDFLGGATIAGGKMKNTGTQYWQTPNQDANNSSGLSMLPGGYRFENGSFGALGFFGPCWTSEESGTSNAWYYNIGYNNGGVTQNNYSKKSGFSVRCIKDDIPSLTTSTISATENSAVGGGNIIGDGGATVTARGLVWSTSPNPTITLSTITIEGSGTGAFVSQMFGLIGNTTYYVRAYATNSEGTAYGNEVNFTTPPPPSAVDINGNTYPSVAIGTQVWMRESLRTTKFNDGSDIPLVTEENQWANNYNNKTTLPMMCWYNNDQTTFTDNKIGALYNWYAINPATNGNKKVCPTGWHVPSDAEWNILISYLDSFYDPSVFGVQSTIAVNKIMSISTLWINSYQATNSSGFSGLPGGLRSVNGTFIYFNSYGGWWSSTENSNSLASNRGLYSGGVIRGNDIKAGGFSVRCLRD